MHFIKKYSSWADLWQPDSTNPTSCLLLSSRRWSCWVCHLHWSRLPAPNACHPPCLASCCAKAAKLYSLSCSRSNLEDVELLLQLRCGGPCPWKPSVSWRDQRLALVTLTPPNSNHSAKADCKISAASLCSPIHALHPKSYHTAQIRKTIKIENSEFECLSLSHRNKLEKKILNLISVWGSLGQKTVFLYRCDYS